MRVPQCQCLHLTTSESRGGVVTIPACTARMGGLLHIIDLLADPSLFGELEREFQRKQNKLLIIGNKIASFRCIRGKNASLLNEHEFLFVHCVSRQP